MEPAVKPCPHRTIADSWSALAAAPLAAVLTLAVCCTGTPASGQSAERTALADRKDKQGKAFPAAPAVAQGASSPALTKALADAATALRERRFPIEAVKAIGASGDARWAWYLHDLLRFAGSAAGDEWCWPSRS